MRLLLQAAIFALLRNSDILHMYLCPDSNPASVRLQTLIPNTLSNLKTWKFGIPHNTHMCWDFYQCSKATSMWYAWWANFTNNLGHRLDAINLISLISFHRATWITKTACAWGDTFMQKKFLPRPEINTRPLSLSLSCFPHGHLFFNSSSNPPHSSPSAVPHFPPLTYLTVFQLMSASPSDHAPPPPSTPHCR